MDHEFTTLFTIFDENRSWYIKENTYKYASRPETVNPLDPGFIMSNRMHGKINYLRFNVKKNNLFVLRYKVSFNSLLIERKYQFISVSIKWLCCIYLFI